ncbi:MAG: hypothetical protein IPO22_16270 [Anaerolineales bacterium]|nr:hypothetical protein [Anaerolineales bacterium]
MLKNKSLLLLSVLLIVSLTACNLPSGQSTATPDLVLTVTAQALLLQPGGFTSTPEFTSTPGPTPTPGFTSTPPCRKFQ